MKTTRLPLSIYMILAKIDRMTEVCSSSKYYEVQLRILNDIKKLIHFILAHDNLNALKKLTFSRNDFNYPVIMQSLVKILTKCYSKRIQEYGETEVIKRMVVMLYVIGWSLVNSISLGQVALYWSKNLDYLLNSDIVCYPRLVKHVITLLTSLSNNIKINFDTIIFIYKTELERNEKSQKLEEITKYLFNASQVEIKTLEESNGIINGQLFTHNH